MGKYIKLHIINLLASTFFLLFNNLNAFRRKIIPRIKINKAPIMDKSKDDSIDR